MSVTRSTTDALENSFEFSLETGSHHHLCMTLCVLWAADTARNGPRRNQHRGTAVSVAHCCTHTGTATRLSPTRVSTVPAKVRVVDERSAGRGVCTEQYSYLCEVFRLKGGSKDEMLFPDLLAAWSSRTDILSMWRAQPPNLRDKAHVAAAAATFPARREKLS